MQFLSLLHTVYLNSTQIIMLQSKSFKMHISNEEKKTEQTLNGHISSPCVCRRRLQRFEVLSVSCLHTIRL